MKGNKKIIVCQAKKELNYTWKFQCTGLSKIKEKNKGNKYHLGFKHSEETKIKISNSLKNKI